MSLGVRHGLARASLLSVLLSSSMVHADDGATSAPSPPTPAAATPDATHATPPPRPPPNTIWYKDTLGDTLALVGVGTIAVGAVFFAEASSVASGAANGTDAGWATSRSTAKTESIFGTAFIAAGLVLFAGAQWRYLTVSQRGNDEQAAAPALPSVGLGVQRNGLSLSYGATF